MQKVRLGEMLVQAGKITPAQLDETLKGQAIFGGRFGTNLVEMGYLGEHDLAHFLSVKTGIPHASPEQLMEAPPNVTKLISEDYVRKYRVMPIALNNRKLTLAMVDPTDFHAIDEISFATGYIVVPLIATELRMVTAMEKHYRIKRDVRYISVEGGSRGRARSQAASSSTSHVAVQPSRAAAAPPPPPPSAPSMEEWPVHDEEEILDLPLLEELSCLELLGESEPSSIKPAPIQPAAVQPAAMQPALAQPPATQPAPDLQQLDPFAGTELYEPEPEPEQDYSLDSVLAGLAEAEDRDRIADLLIGHLGPQFNRVALFLLRGGNGSGWVAQIDSRPVPGFDELEVTLAEPSVLKVVNESKSFYLGPLPATPVNQQIMAALAGGTPFNNLLVPLLMVGRVVAVLYLEGGSTPLAQKLPEIQKLIGKASMAFEILILKSKILMT